MRTKWFFRQLEESTRNDSSSFHVERNNFRSEAVFSVPYSLSLSPNHVIVLAVMISSRREIIFAPIHLKQPCPEGEWLVRMVLSIRLFNNSQLLYIYSFASGRVQPSTVIYFRSFVSFSRLSSTPHLLRLRHFFSTPPDNTHARPAERVEFTFSSSFFFFFFFFNVLLQR